MYAKPLPPKVLFYQNLPRRQINKTVEKLKQLEEMSKNRTFDLHCEPRTMKTILFWGARQTAQNSTKLHLLIIL